MRIAIIGGGFTGLVAAYRLSKIGHKVFVFEKNSYLGGLASTIRTSKKNLERNYHHWFKSDREIIRLAKELGLSESIQWYSSKMGFFL